MARNVVTFLLINFGALTLGSALMGKGPYSLWYRTLNKAPWTPPGWVFGVVWTVIMICFSIYMAILWKEVKFHTSLAALYSLQCFLNILWNPIFFHYHRTTYGLAIIVALTAVVCILLIRYLSVLRYASLFILPYTLWLLVATSLNGYIVLNNGR